MATLYTQKDSNVHKTWFLITVFLVLVIAIGWVLSYEFNSQGILILAIFLSIFMSFSSYWWSDKIVLSLSHAQPLTREQAPELFRIVENLCITAGLPMPRIYLLDEDAPNAFATGRDAKHAAVAVTRGLLQILDENELQGVLAHELSHVGNRDILVSTVIVVLVGVITISTNIAFRSFLWGGTGRRGNDREGNGAGVIILVIGIVALVLAPIAATMLQLAVSRKREFLADASGALLTRYPEGLISALQKISQSPYKLSTANNATAHLYFENPFKADVKNGGKVSWLAKLFMTHPPVEERVAALRIQ